MCFENHYHVFIVYFIHCSFILLLIFHGSIKTCGSGFAYNGKLGTISLLHCDRHCNMAHRPRTRDARPPRHWIPVPSSVSLERKSFQEGSVEAPLRVTWLFPWACAFLSTLIGAANCSHSFFFSFPFARSVSSFYLQHVFSLSFFSSSALGLSFPSYQ